MSTEEHEEIPWSMLAEREQRGRSRALYVGAAVILAVVIGFTGVRWINDHRHGDTTPQAPPTPEVNTTLPAPPTTAAPLLSEADLMAVDPLGVSMAAVARAEWFVTDYFTIDGSPAPDLVDIFVADALLPELPHVAADAVSFVEWARAYEVRPYRDGLVVTVLYRTLFRNDEEDLERSAVRAVDVLIAVDGLRTAVAALPIPVAASSTRDITGWVGAIAEDPLDDPSGAAFPIAAPSADLP